MLINEIQCDDIKYHTKRRDDKKFNVIENIVSGVSILARKSGILILNSSFVETGVKIL